MRILCLFLTVLSLSYAGDVNGKRGQDDNYNDRVSIVDESELPAFSELAKSLSADASWLTPETLDELEAINLNLSEVFEGMPNLLSKDGAFYTIRLEKIGDWSAFSGEYVVYFTHETWQPMNPERALGFINGKRKHFTEEELGAYPAIAIAMQQTDPDTYHHFEPLDYVGQIVAFDKVDEAGVAEPFLINPIGEYFPELRSNLRISSERNWKGQEQLDKATCIKTVQSCTNGKPGCANSYFFLTGIKIKQDHEGLFKGGPEVDLFVQAPGVASSGTFSRYPTTNFIFSGRYVNDASSRTVYLPNVRDINKWYSISNGGVALFSTSTGNEWPLTLIENDTTAGEMNFGSDQQFKKKVFKEATSYVLKNFFCASDPFLAAAKFLIGVFWDKGDDLFKDTIAITDDLLCSSGIGGTSPRIMTLTTSEWEIKGYLGCLDTSCTPLKATATNSLNDRISVKASGGQAPYTFSWSGADAVLSGRNTNPNVIRLYSGSARCTITSADGQRVTKTVYPIDPCPYCKTDE